MATPQIINADILPLQAPDELIRADARRNSVISVKQARVIEEYAPADHQYNHPETHLPPNTYDAYDEFPLPTNDEALTLRKVPGSIPWITWMLCIVEFAERASYYGASTVFANFMQKPLPEGSTTGAPLPGDKQGTAGALGKKLQFANAFVLLFKFLAYTVPIFGAWLGDAKIGRYKAILWGVLICGFAHIIQVIGAIPSVLVAGQGLAPFLISLFLLAFGAGVFKPNILPTVLDQYTHQKPYTKFLKSGEKVIVDPEQTINRISLYFYMFVNIGAFFAIATVYAEKYVGFWLAFLLPGILYFLLPLVLLVTKNRTIRHPPQGSQLSAVFSIIGVAFRRSKGAFWKAGFWDAAKPTVLAAQGVVTLKGGKPITWTDQLVDETKRTFSACVMFLYFPLWYLNDGGIGAVSSAQGASMITDGAPNDLLSNFNPLTIIFFVPLLTHVIYPTLQRHKMMPGRITRITFGFTLAWISSIIGAILQWYIYKTSPCGNYATECLDAKKHALVAPISIWAQIPIFMLGAMSECFCQVTAYEIAYARSPKNMKALVMSIFLFMNALSSAIAQIVGPAVKDPNLVWVWVAPAIGMFLLSIDFYFRYRWMNKDEFMVTYEEDHLQQRPGGGSVVEGDKEKGQVETVEIKHAK